MGVIFLIGAFQAFFFISLVLTKKLKQKADIILVLWLFAMGLHLFAYYPVYENKFDSSIWAFMIILLPPLIYSHGPLLFIYTELLTKKKQKLKPGYLLHFVPLTVSLIYYLYYLIFIANGDISYFKERYDAPQYLSMIFYLLNIFLNPVYVIIVLVKLADHRKKIRQNFSFIEKISLNWLNILAISLGGVSIIVWIVHALTNLNVVDVNFDRDFYIFTSIVIFVFITGFFGFKQGVIYKFQAEPASGSQTTSAINQESLSQIIIKGNNDAKKYEKSQINKDTANSIINKLQAYMENEKPFMQNELSLPEVANKINVSSHILSQVLNVYLQKNFYNFVNAYRVGEVKKMLNDNKYSHYSLLGIAHEAGFNSKSAFNRIFKNVTNQTPTQYKNSI